MSYSIRKKVFLISISTTLCGFLLVITFFNVIIRNYIHKEATIQLNHAIASISPDTAVPIEAQYSITLVTDDTKRLSQEMEPDNIITFSVSSIPVVKEGKESVSAVTAKSVVIPDETKTAVDSINWNLMNDTYDMDYFVLDTSNNSLIYPFSFEESSEKENATVNFYKEPEIVALKEYALNHDISAPQRVRLNTSSYYVMEKEIGNETKAVFYKNVQPLEDLAAAINTILFLLLLLSGIVTIAATMGLTNGIVHSIQKLCAFANAIGEGNLQQQQLQLKEKELSVLEKDMNTMAQKLSEHDIEQKTFFQNVSHELKTPLMSIQGYAEGITSHVFENEQTEEAANIILTESDRLTEMINNLLYLSRLDSGNYVKKEEAFDCTEILKETVEQFQLFAAEKEIEYEQIGEAFLIEGDWEGFQKAISNILTNALRYADCEIKISCDCENRMIEISDDGMGIDEKDLPYIFKRFYKGKNGCSGIGLAISFAAIKSMNGTITAQNKNGAVFTICF